MIEKLLWNTKFDYGSRKGDHDFLFVFYSNSTSFMYRFRESDVFLQTGNDVVVIYALGGAVRSCRLWILKGWLQVYIHAQMTDFAYLQPLKSYSAF